MKLRRIAPLQAGKILAAFYGLLSLVFVPFMMIFFAFASFSARHHGGSTPPIPLMFGMGLGFTICLPFVYAAMGFVFGALGAFIYNLLAKWLGGLEVEFETVASPIATSTPSPSP